MSFYKQKLPVNLQKHTTYDYSYHHRSTVPHAGLKVGDTHYISNNSLQQFNPQMTPELVFFLTMLYVVGNILSYSYSFLLHYAG